MTSLTPEQQAALDALDFAARCMMVGNITGPCPRPATHSAFLHCCDGPAAPGEPHTHDPVVLCERHAAEVGARTRHPSTRVTAICTQCGRVEPGGYWRDVQPLT